MKIICYNNYRKSNDSRDYSSSLTIGKEYEDLSTTDDDPDLYFIIDDNGERFGYFKWRFLSLKEARKIKLEKLNSIK